MTHRHEAEEAPEPRRRMFSDRNLPHWGMGLVALLYIGYSVALGSAGVPQTISVAFTGTLGAWFNYLIQQRANKEK